MAEKICVVCLCNVEGKPRLKDSQSRYYCRTCYDALLAAGFTQPPSEPELAAWREASDTVASTRPATPLRPPGQ